MKATWLHVLPSPHHHMTPLKLCLSGEYSYFGCRPRNLSGEVQLMNQEPYKYLPRSSRYSFGDRGQEFHSEERHAGSFLTSLGHGVHFSRFWRGFIFAMPLKICLELGKSQRWKSLYVLVYEMRETESGYRDRGREMV